MVIPLMKSWIPFRLIPTIGNQTCILLFIFAIFTALGLFACPLQAMNPLDKRLDPGIKFWLNKRGVSLGFESPNPTAPKVASIKKTGSIPLGMVIKKASIASHPIQIHQNKKGLETISLLIQGDPTKIAKVVAVNGGWIKRIENHLVSAEVPVDKVLSLAQSDAIQYMKIPTPGKPLNDVSIAECGGREVAQHLGYQGDGVVVGIVDSGIDLKNMDFRNTDGTTRILYLWDQTDKTGTPPSGFDYGSEYTQDQINAALTGTGTVPEKDNDTTDGGHGTHVLGTAAGNGGSDPNFAGMAPKADLIIVKTDWTGMLDGNDYILRKATETLHKPVVVNNSWGNQEGPHNGNSLESQFLNQLTDTSSTGRAIVFAAGNEGHDIIHVAGSVDSTERFFNVAADSSINQIGIDLWSPSATNPKVGVNFLTDVSNSGQPIYSTIYCNPAQKVTQTISPLYFPSSPYVNSTITIDSTGMPYAADSAMNHINIQVSLQGTSEFPWQILISDAYGKTGNFEGWVTTSGCWIDNQYPADDSMEYNGDNLRTIAEPGCAKNVITVGSYITKSQWTDIDGKIQSDPYLPHQVGDLSIFSSQGPLSNGDLKPDLTAPGEMIASSLSGDIQKPFDSLLIGNGNYTLKSGTSMAAPHVTGAIALMLQKNPQLTVSQIKTILTQSARSDSYTGAVPNNLWGWGKLDVLQALNNVPFLTEDTTAPEIPVVTDDGDVTYKTDTLHARWISYDPESGIAEYQYAIGTAPGKIDILGWNSAGKANEITAQDLDLIYGQTYYFSIRAKNAEGLWSSEGYSDGILYSADSTPPSTPVVTDEGSITRDTTELKASWKSEDPESGIAEYQYAIGTVLGGTDLCPWTSAGTATSLTMKNLSLVDGKTYYFQVKAKNGTGLWSNIGTSDGIRVTLSDATHLSDSVWPMFRRSIDHQARGPYHSCYSSVMKWASSYGGLLAPTSLVIGEDGTLYFGGGMGNNYIFAMDPADGSLKYNPYALPVGTCVVSTPCISEDGTLYVGATNGIFYALNKDLTLQNSVTLGKPIRSSAVIDSNGTIYVGCQDGYLYAINPDLSVKWTSLQAGGPMDSSPAIGPDGTIFVGSKDGYLYAINSDGSERWRFRTPQAIMSSPAVSSDGNTVYMGSGDFKLYAIDINSGTQNWSFQTGAAINSSPAIASDGTIIIGSDSGNLSAVNPDGSKKWQVLLPKSIESSPALGSDNIIYVGVMDGTIHAVRPENGQDLWKFQTEKGFPVWGSPAIGSNGQIYVMSDGSGSNFGKVYAFDSSDIYTCPNNFVNKGWNLFSLPALPIDPNPQVVMSGIDVPNSSLQYWDNNSSDSGFRAYGIDWSDDLQIARPYWFVETKTPVPISFRGHAYNQAYSFTFPSSGNPHWVMFSLPYNHFISCDSVNFTLPSSIGNNLSGDTLSWQMAFNEGRISSTAQGYDSSIGSFFTASIASYHADRNLLEPWYGYWLLVFGPDTITLNLPEPTQ